MKVTTLTYNGIPCDQRINLRVKGKVYKKVVRLATMNGGESGKSRRCRDGCVVLQNWKLDGMRELERQRMWKKYQRK